MIRLNDPSYNIKELPTADKILEHVNDITLFKYYYPALEINALVHSPLRKDDKPSFGVFWSNKHNRLLFKDFGNGSRGNVFIFLMHLWNLPYIQVLNQIVVDFNLQDYFFSDECIKSSKSSPVIYSNDYYNNIVKENTIIQITTRDWSHSDRLYWESYGISISTLNKYRVFPIQYIFLNDKIIKSDRLSYAYQENKDGVIRYKIYQPHNKDLKWINNMVEGTISGFSQLDKWATTLIIASSLKDAMCIHDLGFTNVVAPQTENYIFKPHIIKDFKDRFDNIYVFYDNDKPGREASDKTCNLYNLKPLFTDTELYKDPSDYFKANGASQLLTCIKMQL